MKNSRVSGKSETEFEGVTIERWFILSLSLSLSLSITHTHIYTDDPSIFLQHGPVMLTGSTAKAFWSCWPRVRAKLEKTQRHDERRQQRRLSEPYHDRAEVRKVARFLFVASAKIQEEGAPYSNTERGQQTQFEFDLQSWTHRHRHTHTHTHTHTYVLVF